MDIQKYSTFLTAAETGSMTKAGEILGYTQSGISHMIKSMENELGFALFRRTATGIVLTDEGKMILPIAREIVAWDQQMEQTVSAIRGIEIGTIRVGTFSSISTHWLPRIIKEFKADHPKVNIRLREGGIQEIEEWMSSNIVDIGFLSRQPDHNYKWIPLKNDPLLGVLPKDYPLPEGEALPLSAFNGQPFIMSALGFDYDIHRILKNNKIDADIQYSSTDDYSIVSMVANGLGLSILPELVLTWPRDYVRVVPLDPQEYRTLGVASPASKESSPAIKQFLRYVKRVLGEEMSLLPSE